jgi:hypothetical protein
MRSDFLILLVVVGWSILVQTIYYVIEYKIKKKNKSKRDLYENQAIAFIKE